MPEMVAGDLEGGTDEWALSGPGALRTRTRQSPKGQPTKGAWLGSDSAQPNYQRVTLLQLSVGGPAASRARGAAG